MIDLILDIVAPHICLSCGTVGSFLCERCRYDIVNESFLQCALCFRPTAHSQLCAECRRKTVYDDFWCGFSREGALLRLVDDYKFHGLRAALPYLVELYDGFLPEFPSETVVVGIPTPPSHRRSRGYDHMRLLVEGIAKKRGMKSAELLVRSSDVTLHFMTLDERQKAAKNLFTVKRGNFPETVLLLDDIMTTGTTMKTATSLLRENGTTTVYGAVLLRQPKDTVKRK